MLDNKGFDIWSEEYDKFVERNSIGYPFEGYYDVLNFVYNLIDRKENSKIFDIGIGTGMLTNQLYKDGTDIYGIDFSHNMLQIAREKMPEAKFIEWDFNNGVPSNLKSEKFDYIISSYAIHHLNDDKKINFIRELKNILKDNGKIVIADVAFKTEEELKECKVRSGSGWDEDEVYMVIDKIGEDLKSIDVNYNYTQISSCAGVLEIF